MEKKMANVTEMIVIEHLFKGFIILFLISFLELSDKKNSAFANTKN
jgi:hypothetical protein